jgi:hypothetical protein
MVPREVRTAIGKRCNSIGSTPVKHSSIKARWWPAGNRPRTPIERISPKAIFPSRFIG